MWKRILNVAIVLAAVAQLFSCVVIGQSHMPGTPF
jgi:hypothetical protein